MGARCVAGRSSSVPPSLARRMELHDLRAREASGFELASKLRDHVEAVSSGGLRERGRERDFDGVIGRLIRLG